MIRITIDMQTNDQDDVPGWLLKRLKDGPFMIPTTISFEEIKSFSGFAYE